MSRGMLDTAERMALLPGDLPRDAVIVTRALTREYDMGGEIVHALQGVDVIIRKNEFVAIMGPSGSGKSTLMNMIGCLDTPTGGEGQDEQDETYPGMVPEDFHLQKTEDGFYRKWNNTRDWNSAWQVQNLGLADLIDIAQESGNNLNFGTSEGSTDRT